MARLQSIAISMRLMLSKEVVHGVHRYMLPTLQQAVDKHLYLLELIGHSHQLRQRQLRAQLHFE